MHQTWRKITTGEVNEMEGNIVRFPTSNELRERYIQLALEISALNTADHNYLYDITRLSSQQADLHTAALNIDRFDKQLKELEAQRGSKGWFLKFTDRVDLEEEIMRVKADKDREVKQMETKHEIKPDAISNKWLELDNKLKALKTEHDRLPNRDQLREEQTKVGKQYHKACQREKTQEAQPDRPHTLTDKVALARAESELEELAKPIVKNEQTQGKEQNKEQRREPELGR